MEDVTPFGPSTNRLDIDLEDSRQDPSRGKSKERFGDGPGGAGDRQVYLEGIEHELAESTEGRHTDSANPAVQLWYIRCCQSC